MKAIGVCNGARVPALFVSMIVVYDGLGSDPASATNQVRSISAGWAGGTNSSIVPYFEVFIPSPGPVRISLVGSSTGGLVGTGQANYSVGAFQNPGGVGSPLALFAADTEGGNLGRFDSVPYSPSGPLGANNLGVTTYLASLQDLTFNNLSAGILGIQIHHRDLSAGGIENSLSMTRVDTLTDSLYSINHNTPQLSRLLPGALNGSVAVRVEVVPEPSGAVALGVCLATATLGRQRRTNPSSD